MNEHVGRATYLASLQEELTSHVVGLTVVSSTKDNDGMMPWHNANQQAASSTNKISGQRLEHRSFGSLYNDLACTQPPAAVKTSKCNRCKQKTREEDPHNCTIISMPCFVRRLNQLR